MPTAQPAQRLEMSVSAAGAAQRRTRRRPEVARGEILAAAAFVFAEHGFDGARLDKIARAARINVSLIYHYFANKEDLFLAVLEEAYGKMRDEPFDLSPRGRDPMRVMEAFVRERFRIFVDNPELVGLLNAENVYKAAHIEKSGKIRGLYLPLLGDLGALLECGAKAGVFRGDVDAADLFITINAVGYFYLSNRYTLGTVMRIDLTDPQRMTQREDHIVDVVLSYLRPLSGLD